MRCCAIERGRCNTFTVQPHRGEVTPRGRWEALGHQWVVRGEAAVAGEGAAAVEEEEGEWAQGAMRGAQGREEAMVETDENRS